MSLTPFVGDSGVDFNGNAFDELLAGMEHRGLELRGGLVGVRGIAFDNDLVVDDIHKPRAGVANVIVQEPQSAF